MYNVHIFKFKEVIILETINNRLINIDKQMLADIEGSYLSIYKIKKDSKPFLNLIERNKSLQEAAYIVNPNFNDAKGSVFLKDDGELLYEADFFANTIINEPLDFEYKVKDYTYNHPFSKTFHSFFL